MKIELKNIKYAAFASEETHCFQATVYLDGVKAGVVSNEGHGGPDMFAPHDLEEKINAHARTLPPIDVSDLYKDGEAHTMPQDASTLIGDILESYLEKKHQKRLCAKAVLYRIPGHHYKDGEYHSMKMKYGPDVKAKLVAKYGESLFILNENLH